MDGNPYNPKKALAALLSDDEKKLFNVAKDKMNEAERRLSEREWAGSDTAYARAVLYELDYWVSCTAEVGQVVSAARRLQEALDDPNPPSALTQDADGSFAPGTNVWFLKLDQSTDQLLAREWPWPRRPTFLECINNPVRLVTYLQDLCWSDIARCRRDNRKELNLAISVIARLVTKGGQAGYLNGPGFISAFERFVLDWQDPETGFFGVTYITDDSGSQIRTRDLSLTFHVARYVPHLVRYWPKLIDTLLAIQTGSYPQGWLNGGAAMSDHNNYDVAELFHRGWGQMQPQQRKAAGDAVLSMLKWCLENSVTEDGNLVSPDMSDPIPDSFYYAAAFLDTIGFFNRTKRFWTADVQGNPEKIKAGMVLLLKKFNPYYTEVDDTLVRLGATEHPWTNAIL